MKVRKSCFLFWTLITLMSLALVYPVNAKDKKYTTGFSIFYGAPISEDPLWSSSSKYDWNYTIFCPSIRKKFSERWEIYLEGSIGRYIFYGASDTFSLGICAMTAYDLIKLNRYSLFVELGPGVGWWNRTPSTEFVDNKGALGRIQYGTGFKFPIKKILVTLALRFNHTSAPLPKDSGANTYGILLGIKNAR